MQIRTIDQDVPPFWVPAGLGQQENCRTHGRRNGTRKRNPSGAIFCESRQNRNHRKHFSGTKTRQRTRPNPNWNPSLSHARTATELNWTAAILKFKKHPHRGVLIQTSSHICTQQGRNDRSWVISTKTFWQSSGPDKGVMSGDSLESLESLESLNSQEAPQSGLFSNDPFFSEQLPCRSVELKIFSVFLCQRCREIWREISVKLCVLRFPGFGCAAENFTKISRQKRCGKRKLSRKFHSAGAQR